ncbi:MAG TPA: Glu/Leu/Phe/Val dehydrogenase dimerization domain-containing protein [Acidimicrobiales bacterium]|nr:Glu/Leu/Phe/Val dehydrogenase dimerization domain-containing protein [Acidimicrobiales bacterium]
MLDRLRYGVASGGVRMRPGCSRDEVADLAAVMSVKEALLYRPGDTYRPYGGGKGGIDFEPAASGARGVLWRYVASVRPLLESCWATGPDLGVRQADLDEAAAAVGLRSTIHAVLAHVPDGADQGLRRLGTAFAHQVGGLGLADVVGGYGVARAAVAALRLRGDDPAGCSAVVQGFGSIGGAAARYLAAAGMRVVAVADAAGTVANRRGLDVEHLLRHRSARGLVDRSRLRPGDELRPSRAWLTSPADVLVTAAVSYAVDEQDLDALAARYVVEGANLSLTPAADRTLTAHGVTIVPDVVANCGTNAWWWWTLFGDIDPTPEASFTRIATVIPELVEAVLGGADREGVTTRQAAVRLAEHNMALLDVSRQ